jgi:MerR family transcriptional regulator, thiopeptide resistance regulator
VARPTADASAPLKVGALATRTGVSIRTLHHYDDIGLLSPALRTPSGHRLYTAPDIVRLQHIQALRLMGLSLDAIRDSLERSPLTPAQLVQLQLERLEQQMELQQRLHARLTYLAQQLAQHSVDDNVSIDALCRSIIASTMLEKYFTPDQLQGMQQHGEALGVNAKQDAEREWTAVYAAVRMHMANATPPTDPDLQTVARRWRDVVHVLTAGDRAVAQSVRTMLSKEHASLGAQHANAPDPDMFAYIGRVFPLIGGGPG